MAIYPRSGGTGTDRALKFVDLARAGDKIGLEKRVIREVRYVSVRV
jgi:hypothetical protein